MGSREEDEAVVAASGNHRTCRQRWWAELGDGVEEEVRAGEAGTGTGTEASGETVRGDEFVQVKKYGGVFVKMPARSLFRDGGSIIYFGEENTRCSHLGQVCNQIRWLT
jgi:hypothetical protein